jgi:hypothetical protein
MIANTGLHTSFSLDSDGERVILTSPTNQLVDQIEFPKQHTNVSYGRITDGGATLVLFEYTQSGFKK